ncbi:hypothetical protein ABKV19_014531 [Rosa sericea]
MASTPVGSNALILEVLDRSNYEDWRSRLKTYLLAEDLWEAVEAIVKPPKLEDDQTDYKAWTKKNAKALYAIQNTCGRELFSFIREIETAKSAWEALEQECKVMQGYDENNANHSVRYELFIESVSSGDWDKAKKCLGEVDVRSVLVVKTVYIYGGEIALHVAAEEGHAHIVKELVHLMTQEDLKTKTDFGDTALHLAAYKGHLHIVKELPVLLMGEVKDKDGDTALHIAIQEGKVDIVKELVLLMRQEDLKIKNDAGYTALHLAAGMGHVHVVKELTVPFMGEVPDWEGNTALHIAVKEGKVDIIKELVLLMRQEDLKIKNDAGYTALHLAVNKGNVSMVKEFVRKEKGESNIGEDDFERYIPFTTYVLNGDWDKANECLRELDNPYGAVTAVDPGNNHRNTALHVAAWKGHVDVTKGLVLLLKTRQEDLELKTAEDFTTFGSGVSLGVSEEFLMERAKYMVEQHEIRLGSCLEMQNAEGFTALKIAILNRHVGIAKELLQSMRPEALEEKDGQGGTALSTAVLHFEDEDVYEMAKYMAEKNVKVFNIPLAPGNDIPVVQACRSTKWKSGRYLYTITPLEALKGTHGSSLICLCLNASKTIGKTTFSF